MSKNVRLSIYILIPLIVWMISGVFISEDATKESKPKTLSSVVIEQSLPDVINPKIYLNTYAISEKRVQVRAKTSGEVVHVLRGGGLRTSLARHTCTGARSASLRPCELVPTA